MPSAVAPDDDDDQPLLPHTLFGTTYTLHRLSPLHFFPELPTLSSTALTTHANSLAALLRGDVLRGVRIAEPTASNDNLSRAGRLVSVSWAPLEHWSPEQKETVIGSRLAIEYENITYAALLIDAPDGEGNENRSARGKGKGKGKDKGKDAAGGGPRLMMSRMPGDLRGAVAEYLMRRFDCVVLPLALPSACLTAAFERYLGDVKGEVGGRRGVDLVFAIETEGKALRTVQMELAGEDVRGFWRLATGDREGGFWVEFGNYVREKMGLEVARLQCCKIVCQRWVLAGGEGSKGKFFVPGNNAEWSGLEGLVAMLGELAVERVESERNRGEG